jgi:hypothetical protein
MAATISPELIQRIVKEVLEQITICDEETYPFLKKCLFSDNKLVFMENPIIPQQDGVHLKYFFDTNTGRLISIYIGTVWSGPMLKYVDKTKIWYNLYSDKNFHERSPADTGGIYTDTTCGYKTWHDTIKYRDYKNSVGKFIDECRFTESAQLLDRIHSVLHQLDK